jgi:hypothetical protein
MSGSHIASIDSILSRGDAGNGHRSRERAQALLPDLKNALGLPRGVDANLDHALEAFLAECVLGAAWYEAKYRDASKKVSLYIVLNVTLVLGIPAGLILLQKWSDQSSALPAQITGVLTGILALQKTLSAWYASQQRYAAWYKARSDLKTLYYSFVQQWFGKIATAEQFLPALLTATAAARKIIEDERQDFFQKLALPSFDVLDMLTSSRSTVAGLVTSLLPGTSPATVTVSGRTAFASAPPAGSGADDGLVGPVGADQPSNDVPALFRPALHAPLTTNLSHIAMLEDAFDDARASLTSALGPAPAPHVAPAAGAHQVSIRMVTAFAKANFDSVIFARFRGGKLVGLVADSGNTSLIMPGFEDLQLLPNFRTDYQILTEVDDHGRQLQDPWRLDAVLVRGPIEIPTADNTVLTIPDCVFYALKKTDKTPSNNFGLGIIASWTKIRGFEVRPPLTYLSGYRYLEVDLADVPLPASEAPSTSQDSLLTLYTSQPDGYKMLKTDPHAQWMAVTPEVLTIAGHPTGWPRQNADPKPIAMIDTGGTQTFLSDPGHDTRNALAMAAPGTIPCWARNCPGNLPSTNPAATKSPIGITLGDGSATWSYTVDLSALPATDRDTSLVVCDECGYMMGVPGMNIGGLSMLFNSLLIDQTGGRVGFKRKVPSSD